MPKLNQIIAIEKGTKSKSIRDLADAHHKLQKPALLSGISRTYQPVDDEGDQLPPESTRVQVVAENIIKQTATILATLFDVIATKDYANGTARADIVVDGDVLAELVPVTHLLFLEKQLVDLHTFVENLPVLDASEIWKFDESQNVWVTDPVQTTRTKKIPRNHVKAEATDKHPAQVEIYHEDIPVGHWRTVKMSGAMPSMRVAVLLERVRKLQEAVKFAREEANSIEVKMQEVGEQVLGYLFS